MASNTKKIDLPELGSFVRTEAELEERYGTGVDELCTEHEQLIEQILEEEEQLIHAHRSHIDEVVGIVKDEMQLLNEVDKPGSDVEVYARSLDKVLLNKIKIITDLRAKLLGFYSHLKTEEHMSKLYERNQELALQSMGQQSTRLDSSKEASQQDAVDPQDPSLDSQLMQAQPAVDDGMTGNLVEDILSGAYEEHQTTH